MNPHIVDAGTIKSLKFVLAKLIEQLLEYQNI